MAETLLDLDEELLSEATAIRLKLVVLHRNADFETVARLVPQLSEERIG